MKSLFLAFAGKKVEILVNFLLIVPMALSEILEFVTPPVNPVTRFLY